MAGADGAAQVGFGYPAIRVLRWSVGNPRVEVFQDNDISGPR
jgi:hypothetical protein